LKLFQEVVSDTPELQTSTDKAHSTNSIYVFCKDLRTNSDHLPVEQRYTNCAPLIARDPWPVRGGSVDSLVLCL